MAHRVRARTSNASDGRTTVSCMDVVPMSTNPSRRVSSARADFVDFFALGVGE